MPHTDKRLLLVFPHPDDETYGCGGTIPKYVDEGASVFLLTLTHGEASSQGPKHGLTTSQMGEQRASEMWGLKDLFGLRELFLMEFPDAQLSNVDPRILEEAIMHIVEKVRPQVIVSYPPHGISGFHDHLVTHAVVKRVFVQARERFPEVQRFAMQTVDERIMMQTSRAIKGDSDETIDCVIDVSKYVAIKQQALDIQESIREVIERDNASGILLRHAEHYDFWQENYSPHVSDLFYGLKIE